MKRSEGKPSVMDMMNMRKMIGGSEDDEEDDDGDDESDPLGSPFAVNLSAMPRSRPLYGPDRGASVAGLCF